MRHKVTLIPGEGIGPEVAAARVASGSRRCPNRLGRSSKGGAPTRPRSVASSPVNWPWIRQEEHVALRAYGYGHRGWRTRRQCGAAQDARSLRKSASGKNLPGVKSHFDNVDLIIVRENTEDFLYSGLEHEVVPGVVREPEKSSPRSFYAYRAVCLEIR